MEKILEKNSDYFYFVFRILIGLLFLLHGIQKLPGITSGKTAIFSLIGLAGIIELIAGVLLIVGFLTRYIAFISAIEMLVAYFKAHASTESINMLLNPLANKGEAAILFFAAFLVLIAFGARKWALDSIRKR